MRIPRLIGMTVVALAAGAGPAAAATASGTLAGAGSTLVAPLIAEWTQDFHVFDGISVTYDAVGSGQGLADINSGSVDFAATDSPLTADQAGACPHCVQMPWALTALGVSYHVKGIGSKLTLSRRSATSSSPVTPPPPPGRR